jgi:hypothetical protein
MVYWNWVQFPDLSPTTPFLPCWFRRSSADPAREAIAQNIAQGRMFERTFVLDKLN